MSETQNALASVTCAVDFYTFEGGRFSLRSSAQNQNILSCEVNHSIAGGGGRFSIELPPGGPEGINSTPPWTTILTPMSTVVIALSRGVNSNVVMVGLIENISESQAWTPHGPVTRTIKVIGSDISIYFNKFNWMLLSFLQGNSLSTAASAVGSNVIAVNPGIISGIPSQIADAWLNTYMVGPSGILGKTYFPYQSQNVAVSAALYESLEKYITTELTFGDSYMSEPLSWAEKFRDLLPYPFYETFWGTAPIGAWSLGSNAPSGNTSTLKGMDFYSLALPNATPARPQFIARVLRFPDLSLSSGSSSLTNYSFVSANSTLWNALPTYNLAFGGFISSNIEFGLNNLKNFYRINPSWMNTSFGDPASLVAFTAAYNGAYDAASIHRYGYQPYSLSTRWWGDLLNQGNVSGNNAFGISVAQLTTRMASLCEPLPLMANASVTCELRPDIFTGSRFQYPPFKDFNNQWQFYIDGIVHSFRFGGPSTTTLSLSRGLPAGVYNNSDLLFQILQGNAQRLNGVYVSGVPSGLGSGLAGYTLNGYQQRQVLANIAQIYVSPQAK